MFFLIGVMPKRKEIPYSRMVICSHCGAYGRYRVYMTYSCLTLFFIPVFRWGKKYYVETSCCGTVYELDRKTGDDLDYDEETEIRPEQLTKIRAGRGRYRRCASCGYTTQEDFDFCPKCGAKF